MRRGHDVTLYATGDSVTSARLRSHRERGYDYDQELWDWQYSETLHAARPSSTPADHDIMHAHDLHFALPFAGLVDVPIVDTQHVDASPEVRAAQRSARQRPRRRRRPSEQRRSARPGARRHGHPARHRRPRVPVLGARRRGPAVPRADDPRQGAARGDRDRARRRPADRPRRPARRGPRRSASTPRSTASSVQYVGRVDHADAQRAARRAPRALLFPRALPGAVRPRHGRGDGLRHARARRRRSERCGEIVEDGVTGLHRAVVGGLAELVDAGARARPRARSASGRSRASTSAGWSTTTRRSTAGILAARARMSRRARRSSPSSRIPTTRR